jgi:hypothetical protein
MGELFVVYEEAFIVDDDLNPKVISSLKLTYDLGTPTTQGKLIKEEPWQTDFDARFY